MPAAAWHLLLPTRNNSKPVWYNARKSKRGIHGVIPAGSTRKSIVHVSSTLRALSPDTALTSFTIWNVSSHMILVLFSAWGIHSFLPQYDSTLLSILFYFIDAWSYGS